MLMINDQVGIVSASDYLRRLQKARISRHESQSARAAASTSISSQAGQMGRKSSICSQLETSLSKSRHLLVTDAYVGVGALIVSADHDVSGWLVMPATSERN